MDRGKIMDRINFLLNNKIYVLIMLVILLTIPAIDLVRAQCFPPGTACSTTPTINTGVCGSTSLPVMASGTFTPVGCPSACAGSIAVSCLNGVYTARPNCSIPLGACGLPTCYRCSPGPVPGSTCIVDFSGPETAPDCGGSWICY
jgi:hypothetical protein